MSLARMKGFSLLFLLFACLPLHSWSQETNARMLLADSLHDCSDLQYAGMQLIPLYYQSGDIDTANLILNYWAKKCGSDETIFRTKILWAIDSGTFTDSLITEETVRNLDIYQWLYQDTSGSVLQAYLYYTPEYPLLKWYQAFTDSIVARAVNYPDLSAEESFFIRYYSNPSDSNFLLLNKPEFKDTKLRQVFDSPVEGELPLWQEHLSGNIGMWFPTDNLSTVGPHFAFGGVVGMQKNKMIFNLSADLSVGNSKEKYQVKYQDQEYWSQDFMEVSLRLDIGRQVLQYKRFEADVFGGAGIEILNVLNLSDANASPEKAQTKYLRSPGISFGANCIYYLNNNRFIGIKGRYQLMNFKNDGGTNLRGNAMLFTIEYGLGTNPWLYRQNTYLNNRIKPFLKSR